MLRCNTGFKRTMVGVEEVEDDYILNLMYYCSSFIEFQLILSLQSREVMPNHSIKTVAKLL